MSNTYNNKWRKSFRYCVYCTDRTVKFKGVTISKDGILNYIYECSICGKNFYKTNNTLVKIE